ncbi:MAG: HAMP domain-containing histidine kinase [Lachnospiraceae bacterium]|nr:HAMP domain-containing histidine kinase [Lachnospiraceae bacterium]
MLLVVLLFLAVSSVALFFVKRDQQTIWLVGLCFSFICMFVGIMIYLAKTGGLSPEQKMFLFFDTRIQRRLSYLIFPLRKLGYMIAIGRYLFPPFLLLVAIHYSMIPTVLRLRKRSAAVFALPVLSLVVYYPEIFFRLVKGRFALQVALMKLTQGWIFVYVALAVALIGKEYRDMTIPYLKKQFRYIMVFILNVTAQYIIYCTQDPLQVYQIYSTEYMRFSGRLYANSLMSVQGWYLFTGFTLASVVMGFWNLKNYMVIDWQESREDVSVRRKFDTASMGVSVFVHSIKNQLLSNRVLCKKIRRELEENPPDLMKLTAYAGMLDEVNESMLGRMEELYKSVRQSSIFLSPVKAGQIVDTTLSLFYKKYPAAFVEVSGGLEESLLADEQHLSEALYNLLTNAHEAFLMSGKTEEQLAMKIHAERLYVGFEICDNGPGMTRQEQRKIFDPFYTSKNTNTNWGMGLHYVREIVKSHFGKLKLESRPGEGSSFFVAIPRYEPRQDSRDSRTGA